MSSEHPNIKTGLEIAVVGMSGRFASFLTINEFWNALIQQKEFIKFYTKEELYNAGLEADLIENPDFVRTIGSVMESKWSFDADFFWFSEEEALKLLPQTRLLLELCWHGLEDAGYKIGKNQEKIGIYAGSSASNMWENYFYFNAENTFERFSDSLYTSRDMICSRIAHVLNLTGPSVYLNTMCSSSLVAIDMACKALLNNQCSLALAGGVEINYLEKSGYLYQEGMITSSDGHCKAFDARADGTINGEGAGIVVLKCLDDAIRDGDNIYAVIKGGAVNNDGSQKIGFTAPSVKGQVEVVRNALAFFGG
jgi:acyl transferase domain-containing protein